MSLRVFSKMEYTKKLSKMKKNETKKTQNEKNVNLCITFYNT